MSTCYYLIDQDDRIRSVGGGWDEFAMENGGDGATSEAILGTELWQHIHGVDVKSYLNAIFFAVRISGSTLIMPYRCDSPTQPRQFFMTVASEQNGGLRVDHNGGPTRIEQNQKLPADISEIKPQTKCSICCAVKVADTWLDPFVLPDALDAPPGLYVCPTCKTKASKVTRKMLSLTELRSTRPSAPHIH